MPKKAQVNQDATDHSIDGKIALGRSVSTVAFNRRTNELSAKKDAKTKFSKRKGSVSTMQRINQTAYDMPPAEIIFKAKAPKKAERKSMQQKYEELAQLKVSQLTAQFLKRNESKRQKMLNSFAQINLSIFIELERIKKPQKSAF